ncbi:MAG: chemotaxis protein CheW [Fibrobacterota bacterium]
MVVDHTKAASDTLDLVVFSVDNVLCALRIDEVQEIKRIIQISSVPHAPDYVRGVINLRGQIVTVLDIRRKLNYPVQELKSSSRLVVVKRGNENIGLLVDTIEDAVVARNSDIQDAPSNVQGAEGRLFIGVYKSTESLIAILDLKAILEKDM